MPQDKIAAIRAVLDKSGFREKGLSEAILALADGFNKHYSSRHDETVAGELLQILASIVTDNLVQD